MAGIRLAICFAETNQSATRTLAQKNTGGAVVLQKEVHTTAAPVDISVLAAGIYFVEARQGTHVPETVKLLKK